jgi:alkylhydroperoxidase family enzyme
MSHKSRTWRRLTVLGWAWLLALAWRPPAVADEVRVPLLGEAETWERLPTAEEGGGGPLPVWARALASSLPRTTAAMLELDWHHRAASPLDPKLRGKLRWTAAQANRCQYGIDYAVADLVRLGLDDEEIRALGDSGAPSSPAERAALEFARKMTLAASDVTDEEFARLMDYYGDKHLAAMVLLLAYANFQDRLLLALGLPVEPDGPLPPKRVRFSNDPEAQGAAAPERALPPDPPAILATNCKVEWREADFAELQSELEAQRSRAPRIRVPSWDEVRDFMPPGSDLDKPLRIQWSLVCLGYQPELANAWSACTRAFREEAQQDRVFEQSLFWVITRTIDCFY